MLAVAVAFALGMALQYVVMLRPAAIDTDFFPHELVWTDDLAGLETTWTRFSGRLMAERPVPRDAEREHRRGLGTLHGEQVGRRRRRGARRVGRRRGAIEEGRPHRRRGVVQLDRRAGRYQRRRVHGHPWRCSTSCTAWYDDWTLGPRDARS